MPISKREFTKVQPENVNETIQAYLKTAMNVCN